MGLFYSVGEMAEILGITERSVYRSKSKLPGFVKISGRIYFRKSTFHEATLGTLRPVREQGTPISDRHSLL